MINKRQISIISILIILIGLIGYQYFSSSKSTIKSNMSDFSISDTGSVDKIFVADRRGNSVLLERSNTKNWVLNQKYEASQHLINNLLETMTLMTVKAPVAKARYDKTIRDLSTVGIKVELYQGGDSPSKVIYIGTPNQTHTGTYMMVEGSNLPYLVHIEGFYGFLSPRFSPHENDWRTKNIFKYNPREIQQLRVSFTEESDKGFIIKQDTKGEVGLFTDLSMPVSNWEKGYILEYLDRYRDINFEGWEETKPISFIDSVMKSTPMETYEIIDVSGKTTKIETFKKPLKSGIDIDGNPIDHDQDRMYAVINDSEFVIVQYYVFDPLNQTINYFFKE